MLQQPRPPSTIRFRTTMHNSVAFKVMQNQGWTEVFDEYDWDIFWSVCAAMHGAGCPASPRQLPAAGCTCRADVHSLGVDSDFNHARLLDNQRINHFPRHVELTRK